MLVKRLNKVQVVILDTNPSSERPWSSTAHGQRDLPPSSWDFNHLQMRNPGQLIPLAYQRGLKLRSLANAPRTGQGTGDRFL
jgi:hypothetical protein